MTKQNDSKRRGYTRRAYVKAGLGGTAAATLAGCLGGGGGGGGSDQPLNVLHGWTGGDGKEAIDALTKAFKKNRDMQTNFEPIGGGGNQNLDAVVANRLSNDEAPSSFANWPGKNLKKYEGALGDAGDAWTDQMKNAHVKEAVEACQSGGTFRAMPIGSHRLNDLFYNVSVVEKAGVDPKSLSSVSDLVNALDTVKQNTDAVPMAHGMKNTWPTLQLWGVVMLAENGYQSYMDFIRGKGKKADVRKAFQTTKEILSNYINNDAASIGFTTANQKIMDGDAAFIHQGNWVAGAYKGSENFTKFEEDWGAVTFPGTGGMYTLHLDAFLYPDTGDGNPTPEKTATWLKFVGGKNAQTTFNPLKGSIPTRTDVSTDAFDPYLTRTIEEFQSAKQKPPTLAHGLAVAPETQSALEGVINKNFSGPYNVEAATQGMLDKVSSSS